MEKGIKMAPSSQIESLLEQLRELIDPNSIHYDQDVYNEKDEIKMKILCGEISMEN